jgi:hypothetical protein
MKVVYGGKNATEHLRSGVLLKPGENEVPDEAAAAMLAAGLVEKPSAALTGAPAAPAPEPETASSVQRRRGRTDEHTGERD